MRNSIKLVAFTVALSGVLIALALARQQGSEGRFVTSPEMQAALAYITSEELLRHVKVLASDQFEGRAPGTRGEELTVNYLIEQFKQFGLKPGNPDGTYIQQVPLVGITSQPAASFVAGGKPLALRFPEDYVAISSWPVPEITVKDADIVFAGYGIVAPEYGWDDYKETDVRGKALLMLLGEPQVPDPNDPAKLDDKMFKGRAKSYYALWYHKLRVAAEKGAAAALFVPENNLGAATYETIVTELRRETLYLKANGNSKSVKVTAVVSLDGAKKLIAGGGRDWESLQRAAQHKDFKPLPLEAKAGFHIKNKVREFVSRNVVALCTGADTELRNEYVVYTAHWDHLGRDESLTGDQIYNGAVDNAAGTAGLLAMAQAYQKLQPPPQRSILFLATTAEEAGLLGAQQYALRPLYPFSRTLANINMDGFFPFGRTRDVINNVPGYSTLDEVLSEAAAAQGRIVKPNFLPHGGMLYRSDHYEFAKVGVPFLFTGSGVEAIGKPGGYALGKLLEYNKIYHKVSDEVRPDWDLSGVAEDVRLLFTVGYRVAQTDRYPEWKPGAEFKRQPEAGHKRARR
ncbi:MAG: M28 family peptidase [Acidobacteria bacterium]|nr:M28 family peptidase [Acidobacteriota bacterium]